MRSAKIADIEQRSQDVAGNMLNVDDFGRLTPGPMNEKNVKWWALWTHILEELALREAPYGSVRLMTPEQFPWVSAPEPPRGMRILMGRCLPQSNYLARLGQKAHLIEAIEKGRIRIAPAASYDDPSLNPAKRDDELSVYATHSGESAVIHKVDPLTGELGERITVIGDISYGRRASTNYYVLCLADAYEPRLLDDFGADALLLIHNVERFLIRLERAVKRARPDLKMLADRVTYFDPYRIRPDDMHPHLFKHFRFAYQHEYRVLWISDDIPMDASPFFVELGTLRDIATLRVLS
jgi:hypothetical protein